MRTTILLITLLLFAGASAPRAGQIKVLIPSEAPELRVVAEACLPEWCQSLLPIVDAVEILDGLEFEAITVETEVAARPSADTSPARSVALRDAAPETRNEGRPWGVVATVAKALGKALLKGVATVIQRVI